MGIVQLTSCPAFFTVPLASSALPCTCPDLDADELSVLDRTVKLPNPHMVSLATLVTFSPVSSAEARPFPTVLLT